MVNTPTEIESLRASFDPFSPEMVHRPLALLARARAVAPIFRSDVLDAWVVTAHDLLEEIFRDPIRFPSGGLGVMTVPPPEVQEVLSAIEFVAPLRATDPPDHKRQRRPTLAAVAPRRVLALEPAIRAIANELIDGFIDSGEGDFYESFAYPFPLRVISELLGFPPEVAPRLHYWSSCRVALAWGQMELEPWLEAARGMVEFHDFVKGQVLEREVSPRNDGLSDLVSGGLTAADPMTIAEIVEATLSLVTGGHETTANWLTLSMYHLLLDRQRWDAVCAGRIATKDLVEESLRYDAPVRAVWRKAGTDLELGGVSIAAGDRLYCVNSAANRDPAVFEDPDAFSPGRPNANLHFTFGRATHHCIGASLSRLEGASAFEALAERMPSVRLGSSTDLQFERNATLRIVKGLRIEWEPPASG